MHPTGHPRRHRQRSRAGTGLALRRTADRGRHRRPGALAAGRLAEQAQSERPAHCPGDADPVTAEALQLPLWGGIGEEDRLRARRALVRVQGLLGPEAVQVPVLSGGRGPAERITFTPLGDEPVPRADPGQPWPGQLPEPSPTVLLDDPVELLDADGNPVRVTGRGLFSADPSRLASPGRESKLSWWAGPWPVDERWWDPEQSKAGRTARAQVLVDSDERSQALLLCYRQRRWYVEGIYE